MPLNAELFSATNGLEGIHTMKQAYSYLRFSTAEQRLGDSARRQLEATDTYCREQGLTLSESFKDEGVSGYCGLNRIKGALGKFLDLVHQGKIETGSVLIVESLDRLSRQEINKALELFLSILNADIEIHTLSDKHIYRKDKLELQDLIISLVIMSRANEESKTKSNRLRDVRDQRRLELRNGACKVFTSRVPAWVKVVGRTKQGNHAIGGRMELIEDKAKIVRLIFKLKNKGMGKRLIVKHLNENNVPTFGNGKNGNGRISKSGWQQSYIAKILSNKAVIGEFQPHKLVEGKDGKNVRVADGEPIHNYFPRVIDDKTFYLAQSGMVEDRAQKHDNIANLFTGIVKCAYCESPMHLITKKKDLEQVYLVCSSARNGHTCNHGHYVLYRDFEKLFLDNFRQLFRYRSNIDETDNTKNTIESLKVQITDIENKLNNATDALLDEDSKELRKRITDRMTKLESQKVSLREQLNILKAQTSLSKDSTRLDFHPDYKDVIKDPATRLKMRQVIARNIKSIYIYPLGTAETNKNDLTYISITHDGYLVQIDRLWMVNKKLFTLYHSEVYDDTKPLNKQIQQKTNGYFLLKEKWEVAQRDARKALKISKGQKTTPQQRDNIRDWMNDNSLKYATM